MASESRTSRNGSVHPGPPPRKNTFQKMLELERKNKIERMRASAQETDSPYRASSKRPSQPPLSSPKQSNGQTPPLDARQVSSVVNKSSKKNSIPVDRSERTPVQTSKNTNGQQTISIHPQDKPQSWSDRTGHTRSIDAYLLNSFSGNQEGDSSSLSLTLTDPRLLNQQPDKKIHEREVVTEKSRDLRSKTRSEHQQPPTESIDDSPHNRPAGGSRSNSLSAMKILPSSLMNGKKEKNEPKMIPQYDGCGDSKPSREVLPAEDTPELARHNSNRSSICRSPGWSTHGERGRQREEEKRQRKRATKEAKLSQEKQEKDTKLLREKQEKEAKILREKQEKEQKAMREREEKQAKAMREKEEKELKIAKEKEEKEVKAAEKKQKRLSKHPPTPRRLTKEKRSTSMPAVPLASRLVSSSRTSSFQSADSHVDVQSSRKSFQTKPTAGVPETGFIGGLKLERARRAAMGQSSDDRGTQEAASGRISNPTTRFDLDSDDDENEQGAVRNAHHLAIRDGQDSEGAVNKNITPNQASGMIPSNGVSSTADMVDSLPKPRSPFYQHPPANNSFVDEIFHTINNKPSRSSSKLSHHPLRSHPSTSFAHIDRNELDDSLKPEKLNDEGTSKDTLLGSNFDASSFAARMSKKSGTLNSASQSGSNLEVGGMTSNNAPRSRYENHPSSQKPSNTYLQPIQTDRLATTVAADNSEPLLHSGKRHQVRVLEGVDTKSHSMLIERFSVAESDPGDVEEDEVLKDSEAVADSKEEPTTKTRTRSSSRDWFRRSVDKEPKPTIQERRRSRSIKKDPQGSNAIDVVSAEKSEAGVEKLRGSRRNSISPTISGFKAAAKAAFSKYGPSAPSAQANLPSPISPNRPASSDATAAAQNVDWYSQRQTLPSSVQIPSIAKAERLPGENASSTVTNQRKTPAEHPYTSKPSSITTKGSDEEAPSSPDDAEDESNITTPIPSRPTSKKEHLLTLKSASSNQPSSRIRDEFSPEFLSALDRGQFEQSPVTGSSGFTSSIQQTPITSSTEAASKSSNKASKNGANGANADSFIADAIARVEKFSVLEKEKKEKKVEGGLSMVHTVDKKEGVRANKEITNEEI